MTVEIVLGDKILDRDPGMDLEDPGFVAEHEQLSL
jgi:hypothetical protein